MEKLILLHGAIGSAEQMIPLKEELSGSFDVYNFQFDGHGDRSMSGHAYTISNFVIQLDTFIQDLDDEVHVFGYSMGGFIALISASRGNKFIKSITTLGTKMSWNKEIARNEIKNLNPEVIKEKVPKFFRALEERHGEYWVDVLSRTSDFMESLGSNNPLSQASMSTVNCPVQLLIGGRDQMVSVEETEEVAKWIGRAAFIVLDGVEHPIEKVDTSSLANLITDFV